MRQPTVPKVGENSTASKFERPRMTAVVGKTRVL